MKCGRIHWYPKVCHYRYCVRYLKYTLKYTVLKYTQWCESYSLVGTEQCSVEHMSNHNCDFQTHKWELLSRNRLSYRLVPNKTKLFWGACMAHHFVCPQ